MRLHDIILKGSTAPVGLVVFFLLVCLLFAWLVVVLCCVVLCCVVLCGVVWCCVVLCCVVFRCFRGSTDPICTSHRSCEVVRFCRKRALGLA